METDDQSLQALQDYLYQHIPLSKAMEARIESYNGRQLQLSAPLGPNANHQGTAFGGSLYSLTVLAGWSLLYLKIAEAGLPPNIVIQDGHIRYHAAVEGDYSAICTAPEPRAWMRFLKSFERYGKGRLHLTVTISTEGKVLASFAGDYVVQR